jgi:hypothetical protein
MGYGRIIDAHRYRRQSGARSHFALPPIYAASTGDAGYRPIENIEVFGFVLPKRSFTTNACIIQVDSI